MVGNVLHVYSRFGLRGVVTALGAKITRSNVPLRVDRPGITFPFYLRCRTSDVATFDQIFVDQEYDCVVTRPPKVIVDAGANIGLASIYFANRFPESRIVAIEPEASNFERLRSNVAPYLNIVPVQAALWNKNEEIDLVDPGAGNWGFMTFGSGSLERPRGDLRHKVRGMTVDRIMHDYALDRIDILKVDIEGAEREVFQDPSAWLDRVDALIIELHDRVKPGCGLSFYSATRGFDNKWTQGENVFLTRGHWLTRRTSSPS